jgi:hypothetical protein
MMSEKCGTERVTRDGFGIEKSRTCVEWVKVPTGLFADPGLYAAEKQRPPSNAPGTFLEAVSKVRGLTDDMLRLVEMNACGGPGLKRFGENLRRLALNLTPLKLDGDHVFYLEDLERSRDPERFAHFLLWNMTADGRNVGDLPGHGKSFEVDYAATRETFNALAKVHGRDKMIAAAQRILSAPKLRHAGSDVLANPVAIGCVQNTLRACYWELAGAQPAQPRASAADRQSVLTACETWAADQAAKGKAMFTQLKPYCGCVYYFVGDAADVKALVTDFGPALERLRTEARYAAMNQSCTIR